MSTDKVLKIGSRGSGLAVAQVGLVVDAVRRKFPNLLFETVTIKTIGDKILDTPVSKIGGKSLFTKEIEQALIRKEIDVAVHSLKDLQTEIPEGLYLAAVMKREDPSDCLISKEKDTLRSLSNGARVGTSSLRRQAQILALMPDLEVRSLRGNLDTRIRKLEEGLYDAIVVAHAGLSRMNSQFKERLKNLKVNKIPYGEMLPAVGQGSLAIETRQGDKTTESFVQPLDDPESRTLAMCERAFLRALQGGCQVPVGVSTEIREKTIFIEGLIASLDGEKVIRRKISGPVGAPEKTGEDLGYELLKRGGEQILETIRN